jgi:hypothetical protein
MALHVYRFQLLGIVAAQIIAMVGPPDAVGAICPAAFQDITIDDSRLPDLLAFMAEAGYSLVATDPTAAATKTILRSAANVLPGDGAAILTAANWQDIGVSISLTTEGGTSLGLQVTGIANSSANEGQMRVVANGGVYSNTVVGPTAFSFAALQFAAASGHVPLALPSGPTTTYSFKLQMQATALISSITPRKGCALSAFEYV